MNGKGSKPRPYSVKYTQYCDNWDNIFGKKKETKNDKATNKADNKKP